MKNLRKSSPLFFTFRSGKVSKFALFWDEIFKTCIFLGTILQIEKIALFVGKKFQYLNSFSQPELIFPEYSPMDNTHKKFWIFVDRMLDKNLLDAIISKYFTMHCCYGKPPKKKTKWKIPLPLFHNNFTIIKSL